MDDHEAKAQCYMTEADAIVHTPQFLVTQTWKGVLRPLSKRTKKPSGAAKKSPNGGEKASVLYQKAGNNFKMAKNWDSAGHAFKKSATHREIPYDSCTDYVEASNCYKKVESEKAAECLIRASEIQLCNGKFQLVAKYHEDIGNLLEGAGKREQAIQHYETASQYFRSELRNAAANRCILKAAEHTAMIENFENAIKIYEELALRVLDSNLLKYSAEDHYFRAALCHLCVDFLNAHHAMLRYYDEYPAFKDCRKAKLLEALINCVEETDIDKFEAEVDKYESVIVFDSWYKKLLNKIKNNMIVCGYDLL